MRLQQLVEISGLYKKAPFHFMDTAGGYQPACCAFISQQELEDWLAGSRTEDTVYDNAELGIRLPDIYASDFFFHEQESNYISTLAYMRMTNDLVAVEIENYELLFAAFVILHEYGHWLHFRRCRKSSLDYVIWLNKQLAPVEQQRRVLDMIPDTEPLKENLVAEHIDVYNAMPQEFSANKYALKHLPAFYAKILRYQRRA